MNRYAELSGDHSGKLGSTAQSGITAPPQPPNVSQFMLMVPNYSPDNLNLKLSPVSTNRSNLPTDREIACQLQEQLRRQQQVNLLIRQESKKHNLEFVFAAIDLFTEEFSKVVDKETELAQLSRNSEALFEQLRLDLRNILSIGDDDHDTSSRSVSNASTINRKLLGQLYTIQQLRDYIDELQQQIKDIDCQSQDKANEDNNSSPNPNKKQRFSYPQNSADQLQPRQSFKGTILKALQSPQPYLMMQNHNIGDSIFSVDCYSLHFRQFGNSSEQYTKKSLRLNDLRSPGLGNQSIMNQINQINEISTPFNIEPTVLSAPFQQLGLSGPIQQYNIQIINSQTTPTNIFLKVTTLYKKLLRRYLQSLTTSYKMFVKLLTVARKSLNKVFIEKGKAFLSQARIWLDRVCIWYSGFEFPVVKSSLEEAERFMGVCEDNISDIAGIRVQIDGLLMEMKN